MLIQIIDIKIAVTQVYYLIKYSKKLVAVWPFHQSRTLSQKLATRCSFTVFPFLKTLTDHLQSSQAEGSPSSE